MTLSLGTGAASALLILILKATLLLLAALGASALLQRASAGARHIVWVAVVGALLVLPALAAWGPFKLAVLPASTSSVVAADPAGVSPTSSEPDASSQREPNAAAGLTLPGAAESITNTASPVSLWRVAAAIWIAIAIGVSAWLLLGFLSVRRIVRNARLLEEREWTRPLYEIADRLGIDATPRLMRSDDVKMPFACGLVTPTVILPAEADSWDLERRRAVLMHELAHVRRRDLVGHTLGRLACAVYWFHPLVWTAVKRLRIESERACDDLALTCGLRASNYAEHLLDIVSSMGRTRTPAIAIPMAHRREFEGRMLAILDPEVSRRVGRRQSAAIITGLLALVVVVGGAVPAERAARMQPNQPAFSQAAPDSAETRDVSLGDPRIEQQRTVKQQQTRTRVQEQARQESAAAPMPQPTQVPQQTQVPLESATDMASILAQDTTHERAAILISVLRTDTSASLRRVAAWGLSRYAERIDVGSALATALRRDNNQAVREMAAWATAHGRDHREVIDALGEAVRRDADSDVRETAAWALGNLDAESAVDALADALTSQSKQLRMIAIWALGNATPKAAPRALLSALGDADKDVRHIASWALFRIEDPASVPALEQALNREQDRELRMGYIKALGAIGERSSAALARLLDSRDQEVRAVVVEALAGKGGGPWPWPWPNPRPYP